MHSGVARTAPLLLDSESANARCAAGLVHAAGGAALSTHTGRGVVAAVART